MTITIRAIGDHEIEAFRSTLFTVFGFDPSVDPEGAERVRALLDLRRTYCAFEGDLLVGTSGAFSFDVSVPGAIVPMAGLTMVTVRPTHRRRGILSAMISAHLSDVHERGEPLSGLWASEGGIYGRFGYGVAAEGEELKFVAPGDQMVCSLPCDELQPLDDAQAARELPAIYERARRARAGMFSRNEAWWRYRRFSDRADLRKGRSPRMHVLCLRDGVPTGYVVYRLQLGYEEGTAAGQVDVEELVAEDSRAEHTLLRFVANIDLFPRVAWWNAPPDCVLPWMLRNHRAAARKRRIDTLWLRLCDVPRALSARRYRHDGVLRVAVDDCTFELAVEQGTARCSRVDLEPQLRLSLRTLGCLYLGATAPSLLARAGLIEASERDLAEADKLLLWPIAPWCPEIF